MSQVTFPSWLLTSRRKRRCWRRSLPGWRPTLTAQTLIPSTLEDFLPPDPSGRCLCLRMRVCSNCLPLSTLVCLLVRRQVVSRAYVGCIKNVEIARSNFDLLRDAFGVRKGCVLEVVRIFGLSPSVSMVTTPAVTSLLTVSHHNPLPSRLSGACRC